MRPNPQVQFADLFHILTMEKKTPRKILQFKLAESEEKDSDLVQKQNKESLR